MEGYLRDWREDAANKGAYDTAIFVGDKLLDITGIDKDAIRLAHLYAASNNFFRAHIILQRQKLITRYPEAQLLAARCLIKLSRYDQALDVLGEHAPSHLIQPRDNARRSKTPRLESDTRTSGPSRHGKTSSVAAKAEAARNAQAEEKDREEAAERRFHAGMSYLRGTCYAKGNAFDRAKECYKDAVRIDVQCFEAFDQLMKNALMTPQEEWEFLESLDFDSITVPCPPSSTSNSNGSGTTPSSQQAADLTKMLYTTRLSKYTSTPSITISLDSLATHYSLSSNPDILLSRAELLFTQCRFRDALALTDTVLSNDHYNFSALPVHLACLHELNEKNALFLLAHDFADHHPEEPASWLAVGVYYLSIGKIPEARRFFSKSSMMDPHFGPAWIGFAHTFAAEGEHDQASSAYATAARLFQGTHLPQLFLGMQNLHLQHLSFARDYLNAAYTLCQTDPLLLNEMGVVYYHEERLGDAVATFNSALRLAEDAGAEPRAWSAIHANLGHALRRMGRWDEALHEYETVLRQGTRDAGVFSAKGLVLMEMGRGSEAVSALNEALAVSPQDGVAAELMSKAMEESLEMLELGMDEEQGMGNGMEEGEGEGWEEEFEEMLARKKEEARRKRGLKGKGRVIEGSGG